MMVATRHNRAKAIVELPVALRKSPRTKSTRTASKQELPSLRNSPITKSRTTRHEQRVTKKKPAAKKQTRKQVYLQDDDQGEDEEDNTPVFQTFKSDIQLQNGLSIIRDLGGGRYEIVNLSTADINHFASEKVGREIKSDENRLAIIEGLGEKEWTAAKDNCLQAKRSAKLEIFRIHKLPLELRRKIYEYVLVTHKQVRPSLYGMSESFALLRTCQRIYVEANDFIYHNTFNLTDHLKIAKESWVTLSQNIRFASFDWWGWSLKDPQSFKSLGRLPNLKVLTLFITRFCVEGAITNHKRQVNHQNDSSIKKFSSTNGFDALSDIRGLESVKVKNQSSNAYAIVAHVTEKEILAFQTFLTKELTQPKPIPKGVSTRMTRRVRP